MPDAGPALTPKVSVILPVRNEGGAFARTLEHVRQQDYPPGSMEILVVDGASRDRTRSIAEQMARDDPRIRVLDNPRRIVSTAMNIGIAEAGGDVVVRVDGHTLVAQDYVRRCVEALRTSGADCAGGKMVPRGTTFIGRLVASATSVAFGVGDSHFHYRDEPMLTETAYMGAWPREALLRIGGFDEEMVRNQDDELSYRLRARGGRVLLDPAIRSEYRPRGSLVRLWKQYFQYGFWKVRVFQKHPRMMRPRHFVPAAFVLVGASAAAAAILLPSARVVLASGAALYSLLGWWLAPKGSGGRWALPIVFLTLHSAYGLGFLVGLFRFLPRWFAPRSSRTPGGLQERRR